jgi:peptide chain release factor 2
LQREAQKPDFWQDYQKAAKVNQEISYLEEKIIKIEELKDELKKLKESGVSEVNNEIKELERKIKSEELETFLSGKYDKGNAILQIFSGAGGQDAQDWATMLLRMYERYCLKKGWKPLILQQSFGEGGGPEGRIGTKSATLEIKGNLTFGFLKKETGVHRLVRISPFSAKKLRHTSFALVEVLPNISEKELEIKINPSDLKLETYKSSGPGGQYVNKTESAVRIIHLPTGINVSCQSERSQAQNREKAMKILYAKLYQLEEEKTKKELKEIKGERVSASWGNQIRSYVLHPYKMVKDLRTEVETSKTESVLDGDLDQFIEAEVKLANIH